MKPTNEPMIQNEEQSYYFPDLLNFHKELELTPTQINIYEFIKRGLKYLAFTGLYWVAVYDYKHPNYTDKRIYLYADSEFNMACIVKELTLDIEAGREPKNSYSLHTIRGVSNE